MVSLRGKKALCVLYSGILFGSGIIIIVLSSILLYRVFHHFNFIPGSTTGPLIMLIILGILHLLLTCLGIKAPTMEHNLHLILFLVLSFVLLFGAFTIGVWSMVQWDGVGVPSRDLLSQNFHEYVKNQVYSKEFATVQSELQCCGLNGPRDYKLIVDDDEEVKKLSSFFSCKSNEVTDITGDIIPYEDGCVDVFVKYVELILIESAIMGFLSAILQGVGMFVFISFYKSLREERHKRVERRAEIQRQLTAQSEQQPLQPSAQHSAQPSVEKV